MTGTKNSSGNERRKLGERDIAKLAPPSDGRPYRIVWDTEVKGFGVRVTTAGVRSFILNYRSRAGRARRYTIGQHPDWTLAAARQKAKNLKREIRDGADPMAAVHHERRAPTVAALAERYLTEHVERHNKPSTQAEVRRLVERVIKPELGTFKTEAVTRADVLKMHTKMNATPRQANQALAVVSKMMNLAELWGLRPQGTNPCRHVQRYREKIRDRFLNADELGRLGTVLREMEKDGEVESDVADCIRLLALTGCRLGEILGLMWEHVDTKDGVLRLPDAKAGARTVALGAPAAALLAKRKARDGYVFERARGEPLSRSSVEKAWGGDATRGLEGIRDRAGFPDVRMHDLRHTVGTFAGTAGLNQFIVRDLLGHKTMAMAGRYVSKHIDPLKVAADQISGTIAAALEGKSADVVNLRRGK